MYGVLRLQKETRPDLTNLHFFEAVQKEARGVKILMIAAIIANKKTKKLRLVLLVRYEVSCSTVFYLYDNGIHKLFFERSEVETKSNLQEKKEGRHRIASHPSRRLNRISIVIICSSQSTYIIQHPRCFLFTFFLFILQ